MEYLDIRKEYIINLTGNLMHNSNSNVLFNAFNLKFEAEHLIYIFV